jgi:N-acetylmuramic acid 6-phosphate etherase
VDTANSSPATEAVDPRYSDLDAWEPAVALNALWESQLAGVAAVRAALPAIEQAALAAVPRLRSGGRLVYAGAGTSGRIAAQDGAELPPTFGWPREQLVLLTAGGAAAFTGAVEDAEDDAAAAVAALARHGIGAADVVLGVAASGATIFTCACLEQAARNGALTVAVSNSRGRLLALAANPILVETGPEAIAGSTRLKAGTAQKVVLNLFSTLLMLRLGHVHAGLMVDMHASNAKLRGRAVRMLRQITGADEAAARAALAQADNNVKTAVLVLRGLAPDAARRLLERHGGRLREALAAQRGSVSSA